jgi:hypothetical protein
MTALWTRAWEWLRWRDPAAVVNDTPNLSSERVSRKDLTARVLLENIITGRESQGACRQDEPTGFKQSVVKSLRIWLRLLSYERVVKRKDVNKVAEKGTALEAITRPQPVKIQQTEKN